MTRDGCVSVIIPTYRRPHNIKRALTSVLRQSYADIDVIVVDDNGRGTPDQANTRRVLEEYINADKIRYVVHPLNNGANAARNTGLGCATGEFIAFLDDDDEWLPGRLTAQLSLMKSPRVGVVYSPMIVRYDDLELQYTTNPTCYGMIHQQQLIENYVGAMSSALIRREALIHSPLDETLPARHDYDLWLRLSRAWDFALVNRPLTIMHASLERQRISSDVRRYEAALEVIDNKYRHEIDALSTKERRRREAEQLYFLGSQAIKANRPDLARHYFRRSMARRFSPKALTAFATSIAGARFTIRLRANQSTWRRWLARARL